jgi:hypothetical protein
VSLPFEQRSAAGSWFISDLPTANLDPGAAIEDVNHLQKSGCTILYGPESTISDSVSLRFAIKQIGIVHDETVPRRLRIGCASTASLAVMCHRDRATQHMVSLAAEGWGRYNHLGKSSVIA